MVTSSHSGIRMATRAASIAALPPPIMPTLFPNFIFSPKLAALNNSKASNTSSESSPGIPMLKLLWAPVAIKMASNFNFSKRSSNLMSLPMVTFVFISTPASRIASRSNSNDFLGNRNSGIASANMPPTTFCDSNMVTW